MNKPIITSRAIPGKDNFHLVALGDRAFTYRSTSELMDILLDFNRSKTTDKGAFWNVYDHFRPASVMLSFACVFLAGGTCKQRGDADESGG